MVYKLNKQTNKKNEIEELARNCREYEVGVPRGESQVVGAGSGREGEDEAARWRRG